MRRICSGTATTLSSALAVALTAVTLAGCGDSGRSSGASAAIVTGPSLYDSLAKAENRALDDKGLFDERVADVQGICNPDRGQWRCTIVIELDDNLVDQRQYEIAVAAKGCWNAVQLTTDVRATGRPHRPRHPERLQGCV